MAQPTVDTITLNSGSGGSTLVGDTIGSNFCQCVLVGYSTGDGAMNFVMDDAPLPCVLKAADGVDIGDVDVQSVTPGTAAANLGKAIGGTYATGDTTVAIVGVNTNQPGIAIGSSGQYAPIQLTNGGVHVLGNEVEDSSAGNFLILIGGRYDSSARSLEDGDAGAIALSAAGAVHIHDGGNSITVDNGGTFAVQATQSGTWDVGTVTSITNTVTISGTVTANAGTDLNTSALALESGGNLATIAGAVSGSEMQVDVVGSLPTGTNTIGSVNIVGDVTATFDTSTYSAGVTKGITVGVVRKDEVTALAGTDGDITPLQTDEYGALRVTEVSAKVSSSSGVVTSSGDTQLVPAYAAKKIRIHALFLKATSTTATNIYLHTTTDTNVLGDSSNPIPLAVDADGDNDSGFVLPWNPGGWTTTSTVNEALNLNLSAAQAVVYAITYSYVS